MNIHKPHNDEVYPNLSNRRLVLGISGGIAAYKSAELVRLFKKNGAEVRVVMTRAACEFITPLTMQALSGAEVCCSLLDAKAEAAMGHIQIARWADAILIAPATADCIATLATGRAQELLDTLCLASEAPLLIAPAMNQKMWAQEITQNNIKKLHKRNVTILGPDSGDQACGDTGLGRMLEPKQLCAYMSAIFETRLLDNINVLITAGGTREAIDDVRYLGNHSSGKMGFALARAAVDAGARTVLVCCSNLDTPDQVNRINVESAQDMQNAVNQHIDNTDIFIGAAAVSDFKPATKLNGKLDRNKGNIVIELEPVNDIIKSVASRSPKPYVVGFAAEHTDKTHDLLDKAKNKLKIKQLDMICVNNIAQKDIGFNSDDNELYILWDQKKQHLKHAHKSLIATQLINLIAKDFKIKTTT